MNAVPRYVYIASPYSIGDPAKNIQDSLLLAEVIIQQGDMPICPLLCHLWHLMFPKPYEYWIEYSMQLLRRCDVVFRMPGESKGVDAEVAEARRLGIPVMFIGETM